MKKSGLLLLLMAIFLILLSCNSADTIFKTLEKSKLAPPLGLKSVTQNGQVTLFWYTSNYEKDFGGYFIFQAEGDFTSETSDSALSNVFVKVDSVPINTGGISDYSDKVVSKVRAGLTNGTTYSFAIVTFNEKNTQKISYPSNIVADTPRPDVSTITITSASTGQVTGNDATAGFDFNSLSVVSVPESGYTNSNSADIVNEAFDPSKAGNIRPWLAGMNGAGLQDLGYMGSLDDSDIAPNQGYSQHGESIAVLAGHVFAVKTGDGKFGKLIVTNISGAPSYSITFNAAFQNQAGNRNYKVVPIDYMLGIH